MATKDVGLPLLPICLKKIKDMPEVLITGYPGRHALPRPSVKNTRKS